MYQNLIAVGSLPRDPELKYLQSGEAWTRFSLAVKKSWKDKTSGDWKSKTTWFNVSLYGSQAETANMKLQKGSVVLVEGELDSDESGNCKTYQNTAGETKASFQIRPSSVKYIANLREQEGRTETAETDPFAK